MKVGLTRLYRSFDFSTETMGKGKGKGKEKGKEEERKEKQKEKKEDLHELKKKIVTELKEKLNGEDDFVCEGRSLRNAVKRLAELICFNCGKVFVYRSGHENHNRNNHRTEVLCKECLNALGTTHKSKSKSHSLSISSVKYYIAESSRDSEEGGEQCSPKSHEEEEEEDN